MEWSRRQVLSALGWIAAAPALGCGGGGVRARRAGELDVDDIGALRARLREIVGDLERRFPTAYAQIELRRSGNASVDAAERGVDVDTRATAAIAVSSKGRWFEQTTSDLSADGLAAAARDVVAMAPAGGKPRGDRPRRRQDHPARVRIDPFSGPPGRWLDPLEALFERARKLGGSRMVYRAAFVSIDERRIVFVGDGRDFSQRVVRTHGGVLFVAVTGPSPSAEQVSRAGTAGLELLAIADGELDAGAQRTLALTTARPAGTGAIDVVLAAPVAALVAARCIGPVFEAHRWQSGESRLAALVGKPIGSPVITATDDPTRAGDYGSFAFDDEGWPAMRASLIEAGVVRGALTSRESARALKLARTGHSRRRSPAEPATPTASNLLLAAGEHSIDELIASVDNGLLIETAQSASIDPASLRMAVRTPRAREIVAGRLTGRTFAAIDLIGDLPAVLGSVRSASLTTATVALDEPVAMSATAPALVARARVAEGNR